MTAARSSTPRDDGRPYLLGIKLLALLTGQAVAMHSFAALAPFIRDDLQLGATELGLVSAALYLGTVLAAFGLGGWVDRRAAHHVALVTGCAVTVALGVAAVSDWLIGVALGYLLVGVGRGAIPPLTDRLGYELVPRHQRGVIFGIKQTGSPLGSVTAAMVLPPIAATAVGWRGAVGGTAVAIVLTTVLIARTLPSTQPATPASTHRPADAPAERSTEVMGRLLRVLLTPALFSFAIGQFMAASMTFMALFLVDAVGMDAVRAGRWFAMFGIGGALGRAAWGWLSDNVFAGRRSLALALTSALGGFAAITIGLAPQLLTGLRGVLLVTAFGFFAQGWVGIVRALGAELAGPGYSGRAGGLLLGSMMLGGLLGPPSFGWVVEHSQGYATAWVLAGLVALGAALLMLFTARRERRAIGYSSDAPGPAIDREAGS